MRMTRREKFLLAILLFALLFFAGYRFLVVDQLADIEEDRGELAELQAQIARLGTLEEEKRVLDEQIASVREDQLEVTGQFFSLIEEQEEIILLLNEFLMNPDVNATAVAFTPPTTETVEELELSRMDVTLSYQSNYPALLNMLRAIWQFDRKIVVGQMNMNAGDNGNLSGNFQMNLYDLAHLTGEVDRLFMWFQDAEAVKSNPFSNAAPERFFQVRYLFRDSEQAILAQRPYVPFEDLEGHWAEEAVHALGERGVFPPSGNLNYNPEEAITRAEFIIFLDRLYEWPIPDVPLDLTDFQDYEEIGRYESMVSRAVFSGYIRGYIVGYPDNTLRPNNPITYQ
ncbi:MAG: S-layer homology domain-containing protein, partial [Bacillota bacterium]|nr:S-layer homology domain-containing protein [Bacillota bacterium]